VVDFVVPVNITRTAEEVLVHDDKEIGEGSTDLRTRHQK